MNDQRAERLGGNVPVVPSGGGRVGVTDAADAMPGVQPGISAEAVLAGISDGIIAVDNDWRLVHVNPAAARMWGHGIEAAIGKPIHDALDVGPDNPFRAVYTASKLNNEPVAFSGYSEV